MRRSILACGLLLAFAGMATAAAAATASKTSQASPSPTTGTSSTPVTTESTQTPSRWEVREAAAWRHRAHRAWWRANHPPALRGWLCIHRYEGSWADPGSPYWGGLQMDLSFQRTYGGWLLRHKGTADHWSPLEQIWVAVRAARVRGYSPWPSTARDCGLY